MKCPHCEYYGNDVIYDTDRGCIGPFYKSELTLKRSYKPYLHLGDSTVENESVELIGCPNCNNTFISK